MKFSKNQLKYSAMVCAILLTPATLAQTTGSQNSSTTATTTTTTTTMPASQVTPTTPPMPSNTGPAAAPLAPASNSAQPMMSSPTSGSAQAGAQNPAVSDVKKQKLIQDFVQSAADYIKKNGKDAALAEFNKTDGSFTKGGMYIFAADYNGTDLASPYNPDLVGQNQINQQSPDGQNIVQNMINQAKQGPGWMVYSWMNPSDQQVECKKTFIMPMGDYLIGSGYYYAQNADGTCSK